MADSHLGSLLFDDREAQLRNVCNWLDTVSADATAIYLLGDIFDFWFEFARTVPPGFQPLFDTVKAITARGVEVHFFPGNHDQWTFGFLAACGMTVHGTTEAVAIQGRRFLLAHGHGLGERRRVARLLNAIFESRPLRWLFRHLVVPRWGLAFGYRWSARNRRKHDCADSRNADNAIDYYAGHNTDSDCFQVQWAKEYTAGNPDIEYIVMGHYHREVNMMLASGAQLLVLDAFYKSGAYAAFDGTMLTIDNFSLSRL